MNYKHYKRLKALGFPVENFSKKTQKEIENGIITSGKVVQGAGLGLLTGGIAGKLLSIKAIQDEEKKLGISLSKEEKKKISKQYMKKGLIRGMTIGAGATLALNIIANQVGKKNFERLKKERPDLYGKTKFTEQEAKKLIDVATKNGANVYKGEKININVVDNNWVLKDPQMKRSKISKDNLAYLGGYTMQGNPNNVQILKQSSLNESQALRNLVTAHEIGHAKKVIDNDGVNWGKKYLKYKDEKKLSDALKSGKITNKELLNDMKNILKTQLQNTEKNADKNIQTYLKQIGMDKANRQAHYWVHRNQLRNNKGRYMGLLGDLRYLKDYMVGFSRSY